MMNAHLRQSLGLKNKIWAYRSEAPWRECTPLIDVLIHLVICVTVCEASNVCWLLMTSEPLKMPVFLIQLGGVEALN